VVELSRTLLLHLIRSASSWIDHRRRDATVTAILIADGEVEVSNAIRKGFRDGHFRIDRRLVIDLYADCTGSARAQLVAGPAFGFLDPKDFEGRFLKTFRSRGLTLLQRRDLTDSLRTHLWRYPERVHRFAPIIVGLLRSREMEYRNRGLILARNLLELADSEKALVSRALRDRRVEIRMSAHNLLFWWLKRKSELSPDLRAFCTSPEIRTIAFDRYRHDPDVNVKTCAYYFLKALEPRAGHKPPKGMPVPPPRRKRRRRRAP